MSTNGEAALLERLHEANETIAAMVIEKGKVEAECAAAKVRIRELGAAIERRNQQARANQFPAEAAHALGHIVACADGCPECRRIAEQALEYHHDPR